jgi:hypothetical protein
LRLCYYPRNGLTDKESRILAERIWQGFFGESITFSWKSLDDQIVGKAPSIYTLRLFLQSGTHQYQQQREPDLFVRSKVEWLRTLGEACHVFTNFYSNARHHPGFFDGASRAQRLAIARTCALTLGHALASKIPIDGDSPYRRCLFLADKAGLTQRELHGCIRQGFAIAESFFDSPNPHKTLKEQFLLMVLSDDSTS